ncbi:oocyte zinc finger protein XlCOF22-like [Dunckerocampus dactyliophorus]|uniref:oocyte zinc finger protein XlCOF22-like n=1 Tax=Dunckerocampus dactyliophorus TaxID=161453 RepID=UPI0024075065|nr:oocyte zinc finger protein XlCOF22-like [Dunckerocampus dactyliophorus]
MNHCYAKMATSCQREGGRESPTPRKSSTEKKPQTADNDVQQLICCQEECPTQLQRGSSTLKPEDPQPPHVKEEEEELWITQEGLLGPEEADLTKLPLTVVSVKTEDHEDKPPESLHWLFPAYVRQEIGCQEEHPTQLQEGSSTLKQEEPQHPQEEEEELWTIQEGECLLGPKEADITKLPLTGVSVKTEDHEDKPPKSSHLHHSPSEENRGVEPPSSSSPQHMTPEADGDLCGGSQADNLLAPLSDSDDTSLSSEDEDWDGTQEPLSSNTDWEGDMCINTERSECSEKKTVKKHWTCSVCARRFSFKCHLTQHMRTHTGEKCFACSVCDKRFSDQSNMVSHMRTHTAEKPFSCSVCAQRFFQKAHVVSHMRMHTGEKPFSCSVCCKRFFRKEAMIRHMRTHTGEKPFVCSDCGQRFTRKLSMVSHMRAHTGEKPVGCSVCGQRFSRKSDMVRHMRTHTGHKPFSCSVCDKRFIQKGDVVRHMRTHTREKPFDCSVCGQKFSRKSTVALHMRTHTGEKPFSCSVCGQGFSQNATMVSHMRTHTGEKPFSCSVCGESYSCKKRLTTHMQTHNGE